MQLLRGTYSSKLSSFPSIEVNDPYGVSRNVYFEEVPEASSGVDSIELTDFGSSYTSTPTVTIGGDGSGATAIARVVGGRVTSIEITNPGTNYTSAVVSIVGGGGSGASGIVKLQVETGTLRTIYYKTNGEKIVLNSSAGTIDYSTGRIVLTSLRVYSIEENDYYGENVLTISIPIQNDTVPSLRNRILDIDTSDGKSIGIMMVSE